MYIVSITHELRFPISLITQTTGYAFIRLPAARSASARDSFFEHRQTDGRTVRRTNRQTDAY